MDTFTPTTDPLAGSIALSAIVSLLPLLTFFVLLAVVKAKAHVAGLASLLVAIAGRDLRLQDAGRAWP